MVATVPTGLQTCAKILQIHLSGGGGTPRLQPKSNATFKFASTCLYSLFWLLILDLNTSHYSGHCAYMVANLYKSGANAPFRGWGDTLVATQK